MFPRAGKPVFPAEPSGMDSLAVITIVGTGIGLVAGCVQIVEYLERRRRTPSTLLDRDVSHLIAKRPAPDRTAALLEATPAPAAPLETERTAGNLPASVTSFIGRSAQTAEVRALLHKHRLLTLLGAGGAGKTRLALHVAEEMRPAFPGGAWLAELASLSDPALVPQTVAAALDVREEAGTALTQTLIKTLARQPLLLVLDNCEHLLPAVCTLVQTLLLGCPNLRVLATSRSPLGVSGEQSFRVPPLSVPDAEGVTAYALASSEAVQLFVERAKLADPRFLVTDANAAVVARICRRLDGIPLALELAAARVRSLPMEQISARLDDRFRLLTGGAAGSRQETLRATVDWSYNGLDEDEKRLLRALSVFAGGWTLEAAEAIGTGDDVLDRLTGLVDKSLVTWDASRYGLLETVRQYAAEECAAAGETDEGRARHGAYFLALAEEAAEGIVGPEQGLWLARLEEEHDNCRAALTFFLSRPEDACEGLRLAGALQRFWWTHGYLSEARDWFGKVLAHDTDALPTAARALALQGLGNVDCYQGHHDAAQPAYAEALAIREKIGDRRGMAGSLGALGNVAQYRGDWDGARALFERSIALSREVGNRVWEAASLTCLCSVAYDMGDYAAALDWSTQAAALDRENGNRAAEANTLMFLGKTAQALGDYEQAQTSLEKSIALSTDLGDHTAASLGGYHRSLLWMEQGKMEAAHAALREFVSQMLADEQLQHVTSGLAACVEWAHKAGRHAHAATLGGAVAAQRLLNNTPLAPLMRQQEQDMQDAARAALGDGAWQAAWDAGQRMTPAQSVAYALSEA